MEQGMEEWIFEHPEAKKRHPFLYYFRYNDKPCAGIVTVTDFGKKEYILNIRPIRSTDDIGEGAGGMISKIFKNK